MADASGLPTISESPSPNEHRIRLTKRKLDDAFHILDSAVSINDNSYDRQPPPKRSNTIKSLYSTLAKYGIKSKEPSSNPSSSPLTKNTPNLSAILSRAASKTKSSFSFKFSPSQAPLLPATADYRPSSLPSFLTRLSTYKLSTYANKPPAVDAVAASKCGWINDGKDRLVCGLCSASWVVVGREGLGRDAANTLVERQRASLVESHKNGCPWKTRQCDDTIYTIPLQSPGAMIREIMGRASIMNTFVKDVLIKHPLTATQLNAFRSTVASYSTPDLASSSTIEPFSSPSETALLVAFFGWSLVPLSVPSQLSSTIPPSPPFSRASSVAPPQTLQKSTPGGPSNIAIISSSSRSSTTTRGQQCLPSSEFTFLLPSNVTDKPDNALLQCTLCQRRIGLWAFTNTIATSGLEPSASASTSPSTAAAAANGDATNAPMTPSSVKERQSGSNLTRSKTIQSAPLRPKKSLPQRAFDLLKEHRSYCPYAVRSTVVPSFPLSSQQLPTNTTNAPITRSRSFSSSSFLTKTLQRNGSTGSLAQQTNLGGVPGEMEGWRAVLTVVLRYGMAEKQRLEHRFFSSSENGQDEQRAVGVHDEPVAMEVDTVKAMVNGVKTRGGRDLLKYVKGLLG